MSRKGTTSKAIKTAERAKKALKLRREGRTLEEIAEECGYADKSGAFRAIKRELTAIPVEDAEELRKLELMRLDYLESVCHKRLAEKGKHDPLWAVDRLIAISESRRKLMGLDTPVEVAQMNNVVVIREIPFQYLGNDGVKSE